MSTADLSTALSGLVQAPKTFGAGLTHAMLLRFSRLCLALFTLIGQRVHQLADPRLVLAHARVVEAMAQEVHAQRLSSALDAELTAASTLSAATLEAIDDEDYEFAGEPEREAGRAAYQDAPSLLAAWWNISYFEAAKLVADAHLLIGRRTMAGTPCPPRFARLAALYRSGSTDRRALVLVARQLNALEPEDTTFEGVPTQLAARDADGTLLEERAAAVLDSRTLAEGRAAINTMVRTYKDAHDNADPPKLGIFPRGVKKGVHQYLMNADALQAEVIDSIRAQSGKKTAAGKEARQGTRAADEDDEAPSGTRGSDGRDPIAEDGGADAPQWLRTEDPKPDWAAGDDDQQENAGHEASRAGTADSGIPGGDAVSGHGRENEAGEEPEDEDHAEDAFGADDEAEANPEASPQQRWLNAVINKLLANPSAAGNVKTVTPKIIVKMTLDQLIGLAEEHSVTAETARSFGQTLHGNRLNAAELRQLLAQAQIIPVVLGGNGQPLDVGRSRRFPTAAMRHALLARDGGCIVPGCTVSPERTEADHYRLAWAEGGETSISNLVLECSADHVRRHLGRIRIVDVDGLPHVVLPEHVDPAQKPRRNTLWSAVQLDDASEDPSSPRSGMLPGNSLPEA